MAVNQILLDTNAYVAFKQGQTEAVDMWIAASALQHGYALFSYDGHFQHVDGLLVGAAPTDLLLP